MSNKNIKEALYVQVPTPDGGVEFNDATPHIGRMSPFKKPKMICGMAVSKESVSFSLLMLTKKSASAHTQKELSLPRGAIHRLDRVAKEREVPQGNILIEVEGQKQMCRALIGGGGILELEPLEDDIHIELPRGAVRATIIMNPPGLDRPIAVGFIGYPGKPGTPTSVRRVSAMALYNLSLLAPFRILTAVETVSIPAAPTGVMHKQPDVGSTDTLIPVWLFSEAVEGAPTPVASGEVLVSVDTSQANPTTGRLVVTSTPQDHLEDIFEPYKDIFARTVSDTLVNVIGEPEIRELAISIVLGDLSEGHVGMLKDALGTLSGGLDLTPSRQQKHVSA